MIKITSDLSFIARRTRPDPVLSLQFSGLYIVSFLAILVGFVMFNATTLACTAPVSPAECEEVQDVTDGPVPCPQVKDGLDGLVLFQDQAGAAEQEVMRSTKI